MTITKDDEMGGAARIEGHRIAVYHVVQYRDAGYSPQDIADEFDLDIAEVREAVEYAEEHGVGPSPSHG